MMLGCVLHPVVTVTVWVGITQPSTQPGQLAVTVWVGVCGQQSVLYGCVSRSDILL